MIIVSWIHSRGSAESGIKTSTKLYAKRQLIAYNWLLLNKKVLNKIGYDLSDEEVDKLVFARVASTSQVEISI